MKKYNTIITGMTKDTETKENGVESSDNPSGLLWDSSQAQVSQHWKKIWKFLNSKKTRQSPINIDTKNVQHDESLKPLNLDRQNILVHVTNIGWNISFKADNVNAISFTGGGLVHNYAFREMHFHWGEVHKGKCELGCEHTIDGKRYAAEFHAVHWNTDLYQTENEAIANPDGLAVIGILIDANEKYEDNKEFEVFLEMFDKVPYMNNSASFNVDPYLLLPKNLNHYFTYPGSLTMPPLTENVSWTVLPEIVRISLNQLERMSKNNPREEWEQHNCYKFQRQSDSSTITNNFRYTQPINDRVVRSPLP
ncbi:carbonic anhydrase 2 isoform X2 [Hydra vulgaris]|uniref:carbonic anhydrase 2 isoform X2 n=1 Tax=Hydra vulgaris TaxID=6087 RepID=UPI001F5F1DCF|nr:carbonic anhydrase 2-like isoform X2 [Hydra vulgaris]